MTGNRKSAFPWIFETFAIYARSHAEAQQVFEQVRQGDGAVEPFGIVCTATGEEVAWVNTRYIERTTRHGIGQE